MAMKTSDTVGSAATGLDGMSEQEIVEIYKNFSLSAPIRIPTHMLSPNFVYRWINKRDKRVFTRRRGVGWVPVREAEVPKLMVAPYTINDLHLGTHIDADGVIAMSDDLVLAKLPKRVADAIEKYRVGQTKDRLSAGRRRFHQAGEQAGVATDEKY